MNALRRMPRHILFLRLAYQAGMCLLALVAVTLTAIDLTLSLIHI